MCFADGHSKDQEAVISHKHTKTQTHTHTQPRISYPNRLHMFRNTRDVDGVIMCGLRASIHGSQLTELHSSSPEWCCVILKWRRMAALPQSTRGGIIYIHTFSLERLRRGAFSLGPYFVLKPSAVLLCWNNSRVSINMLNYADGHVLNSLWISN